MLLHIVLVKCCFGARSIVTVVWGCIVQEQCTFSPDSWLDNDWTMAGQQQFTALSSLCYISLYHMMYSMMFIVTCMNTLWALSFHRHGYHNHDGCIVQICKGSQGESGRITVRNNAIMVRQSQLMKKERFKRDRAITMAELSSPALASFVRISCEDCLIFCHFHPLQECPDWRMSDWRMSDSP